MEKPYTNQQLLALGRMRLSAEKWALVLLAPIVAYFAAANLARYPTMSGWDEGIFLQFASNLARHGEYATRSGGIFERMMPLCSVGPTVIAPAALALWLSDYSLVAARAVSVIYLFVAVAGLYLLMRYLGGWVSAIIGVLLFLVAGFREYDTLWLGRQVLGEVAALAFVFWGLWAWLKGRRGSLGWVIASAILISLAVVTKNQLIWLLGPGFALIALIDRLYYRQLRWAPALAPLAAIILGYAASLLFALWIVGPSGRATYLEAMNVASSVALLHAGPQRWLENNRYFGRLQWAIALVTIGYGFYRSRVRSLEGFHRLMLPVFAVMALLGFIGLGLPWARNLHSTLTFVALCNALLIYDLACWVGRRTNGRLWSAATLALLVAVLAVPGLIRNVQRITTTNDASVERFAALVDQYVPVDSHILNWEWEVEFYSQRLFVHPPYQLSQAINDEVYNGRRSAILDQPRVPPDIGYLIVGPFAQLFHEWLFDDALAQRPHRLLADEGPYRLYQFQ